MRYLPIILTLLAFINPANAQSSKADKAIQCSAIYHIATSITSGNKQAANAFMSIQRLFEGVFSANERQRLNRTITNGMVSKKKSQIQMELAKTYDRNPQPIYALEMQCNAWRERLAPYFVKRIGNSSNRRAIQSAILSAPDVPAVPSASHPRWPQSKMMMDKSFFAWTKTGRVTTESFKKKLRDSLKKNKL
jgi:hypothetical protein